MKRLEAAWNAQQQPSPWSGRRSDARQRPQRDAEHGVRRSVVAFRRWTARHGLTRRDAAERLWLAERTLAEWEAGWRQDRLPPQPRGRPLERPDRQTRNEVIEVLRLLGPRTGLPTLQGRFPELARATLADLLHRFRRVYRRRNHLLVHGLHWHRPGTVWAIDYAQPPQPIEGQHPALVAVRDLASGQQLAWLPVEQADASAAADALTALFREHGAPLVLKADNGSPFTAEEVRGLLDYEQVVPLFSPMRYPQYNGACEAGIGSLKTRTHHEAARHARPGDWTCEDGEAARRQANETARPWGAHGPTPAELWQDRQRVTAEERATFGNLVRHLEVEARQEEGYGSETALDQRTQAALDRRAIRRALGALGILTWTRRRIPLPIKRQKVARIT